ncbi:MAG: hypothetical protein C0506_12710 [Anaerolinea sp.]|nr:hypothetical protein [Anaerolinea sp.]
MLSSIVLAAGFSTRMGRPKALLDWGGQPLIAYQVQQLKEAGADEVIVVLGHRADEVHRAMKGLPCRVMINARYQMGRASSLRIGAKAASRDADGIIVINVDQPRPIAFLKQLIAAFNPERLGVRPVHHGHHGHPVLLSGRLREELMGVDDGNEGLLAVIRKHAAEIDEVETGELLALDINTPEDYEAARRQFGIE